MESISFIPPHPFVIYMLTNLEFWVKCPLVVINFTPSMARCGPHWYSWMTHRGITPSARTHMISEGLKPIYEEAKSSVTCTMYTPTKQHCRKKKHSICEKSKSMMKEKNLHDFLWVEVMCTTAFLVNRNPIKVME